ncbi:DEAD/DEAH box helicase [Oligoflexaceae bacterium]|nr:DEAD/DEAH box helicase [Oligoflexaceae bacterium]
MKKKRSRKNHKNAPPQKKTGGRVQRKREEDVRKNNFSINKAAESTRRRIKEWLPDGSEPKYIPSDNPFDNLDPWQSTAVQALLAGENVVVDAPTTAGKTRVVECYFHAHLGDPGFRAAYTTPVKSLSNDKFREFRELYGEENVGLATGDIKENLSAPIVVATLETYRNSLLGTEPDLSRNLVIFDEYHYMQDGSRGSAWEESIILTPSSCQLLLLSASVQNSAEFCGWLGKIFERKTQMVRVTERPVPLADFAYYQNQWLSMEDIPTGIRNRRDEKLMKIPMPQRFIAQQMAAVEELKLTPCILYSGRRLGCETMAFEIAKNLQPLSESQSAALKKKTVASRYLEIGMELMPPKLKGMMLRYGVAFHHSGLSPNSRIVIESLLKEGDLRFCVATMGLSLGINFSVRSAMITDYRRPDEEGFVAYSPSEVLQMLGRAGRRGKDAVGFSLWPSLEAQHKLGRTKRRDCSSRLKNDPTTFLGLIGRGYNLEAIERFYSRSFRRYQDQSADLSLVTAKRVKKRLETEIPCNSPAYEYVEKINDSDHSLCHDCSLIKECHKFIKTKIQSDVSALHLHLYVIEALDRKNKLTDYGELARYFPQSGGMVLAAMIHDGRINENNIIAACELAACLGLAHYKKPNAPSSYKFPFNADLIEREIFDHYPEVLFPEVYDSRGDNMPLKDFNPAAGYVLREWIGGASFAELCRSVCSESFKEGDLMNLMYRVSTYLQSIAGSPNRSLAFAARATREQILRDPISVVV